jgi:predicted amidophosphoribosyltransferase
VNSLDLGQTRVPVIWREAYGGMLTDTVIRAKYFGNWGAAQMLGESLGQLPKPWLGATPVLIPIPLASRRLADRGFNQSMVIGKSLAKKWQLPIQSRWLRKCKPSARQASLSGPQRRHNLSGLFEASAAVRNQRVVLVDDIMTSGATLSEAARAIAHAGGQVVAAAVIARVATPPRRLQSGASPTPFVPHVQRRSL